MKISSTINIESQPEEVFLWLNDPRRAMNWMTSVSSTEVLNQTEAMVGTTFRETVEEGGRGTEMHGVVTGYAPNRMISFHLRGKFNTVDVEYRLEGLGNRTRPVVDSAIHFRYLMRILGFLIGPTFKKKIVAQMERELAALKDLCEASPREK